MKVLVVKNEYTDVPKTYYRWDDPKFYMESIIEEVKQNILEAYPIKLNFVEMTEDEFEKLPSLY